MSEFEVPFSCQGGKKIFMKFIGCVFMCHPSYKMFQFLSNICREVVHLPFPFVFSSWAFGVNFFWIIVRTLIEVLNGEVLIVLHPLTQLIKLIWPSQPQDCLEDVLKLLLEFLLGIRRRTLARIHPLVSRECWYRLDTNETLLCFSAIGGTSVLNVSAS